MNASEIRCFIKGHYLLSKFVRGVYSPDTLPFKVDFYPSAYVCNVMQDRIPLIFRGNTGSSFGWKVRKKQNFLTALANHQSIMMNVLRLF